MTGGSGLIPDEDESIYYCEGLTESGKPCGQAIDFRGILDSLDIYRVPNHINYVDVDPVPKFDCSLFSAFPDINDDHTVFKDIRIIEPDLYSELLINSKFIVESFLRDYLNEQQHPPTTVEDAVRLCVETNALLFCDETPEASPPPTTVKDAVRLCEETNVLLCCNKTPETSPYNSG